MSIRRQGTTVFTAILMLVASTVATESMRLLANVKSPPPGGPEGPHDSGLRADLKVRTTPVSRRT